MKKKQYFTVFFIMIAICTIFLAGCGKKTVEQLQNDHGIVVDGGSFEKGSELVSNEVNVTTTKGQEVIEKLSNKEYNKTGIDNLIFPSG